MKKVTFKSVRTGQTIYFATYRWDVETMIAYVDKIIIGSKKLPYTPEGQIYKNPINVDEVKDWLLLHQGKRPEARVKVFYSKKRAQCEVDKLNDSNNKSRTFII